jgi:DNA polymerase-3 subunit epsilon
MFEWLRRLWGPQELDGPDTHELPVRGSRRVRVIDTETTGLAAHDRLVSFAGITLTDYEFGAELDAIYAVFNPMCHLHPAAARVNGWDDETLKRQEPFASCAEAIHEWLSSCDLLVAHNAAFDMRFVQREFELTGMPPVPTAAYCTLEGARRLWPDQPANLNACAARFGYARSVRSVHNPVEDAWLAANLFRVLNGLSPGRSPPLVLPGPANLRTA